MLLNKNKGCLMQNNKLVSSTTNQAQKDKQEYDSYMAFFESAVGKGYMSDRMTDKDKAEYTAWRAEVQKSMNTLKEQPIKSILRTLNEYCSKTAIL
jgi:hypothetical protein